jgi:hypothetical protein
MQYGYAVRNFRFRTVFCLPQTLENIWLEAATGGEFGRAETCPAGPRGKLREARPKLDTAAEDPDPAPVPFLQAGRRPPNTMI